MTAGVLLSAMLAGAAPVPAGLPQAPAPRAVEPDATLLLVEEVPDKEGTVTRRRLVRIDVRNGRVWEPETIWEGEQRFFSHFGNHRIVRDRFVVTAFGGVIDLRDGKVISSEMHGHLDAVEGSLVYYWIANSTRDEGMFTFNLDSHEIHRVAKPGEGRLLLRGLRSPDGTKSAEAMFSAITLHKAGGKSSSLGNDFKVDVGVISSHFPSVPVLWLDNDRVLTQVKNGELVAVDLKGKQKPVVTIPLGKNPGQGPKLSRDPTGRIVYECGDEAFEVDAKAKQWARTEWTNLGHGFQMSRAPNPKYTHTFRHNGRDIGTVQCHPWRDGHVAATKDYLAVVVIGERGVGATVAVRIWSASTRDWISVKLHPNCLVGWVN
jgi:hypothetical protein